MLLGGFKSKNKRCANSVEVSSSLTTVLFLEKKVLFDLLGDVNEILFSSVWYYTDNRMRNIAEIGTVLYVPLMCASISPSTTMDPGSLKPSRIKIVTQIELVREYRSGYGNDT